MQFAVDPLIWRNQRGLPGVWRSVGLEPSGEPGGGGGRGRPVLRAALHEGRGEEPRAAGALQRAVVRLEQSGEPGGGGGRGRPVLRAALHEGRGEEPREGEGWAAGQSCGQLCTKDAGKNPVRPLRCSVRLFG
ncbi:hypothetical protein ACJJTC_010513 [Scirpophaga incertulas]